MAAEHQRGPTHELTAMDAAGTPAMEAGDRAVSVRMPMLGPSAAVRREMVRTAGLEPATSCSGGKRSIRLSYARTLKRW